MRKIDFFLDKNLYLNNYFDFNQGTYKLDIHFFLFYNSILKRLKIKIYFEQKQGKK